jgi:hypothetical protein
MGSVATLVAGATRLRLAAYSLMTMAGDTGPWRPSTALEREAGALRAWYLRLAEAIRRIEPAPRPERVHAAATDDALRHLDEAVRAGEVSRIRAALGAALASEHIENLREFESPLASALEVLSASRE